MENIRPLLQQVHVRKALLSRDEVSLGELLGMNFFTFERYIHEKYALTFRGATAASKRWEFGCRGRVWWGGADDGLGTVSTAALWLLRAADPEAAGLGLGYCGNVHSGTSLDRLFNSVDWRLVVASRRFITEYFKSDAAQYNHALDSVLEGGEFIAPPSKCGVNDRVRWARLFNAMGDFFSKARQSRKPFIFEVIPESFEDDKCIEWFKALVPSMRPEDWWSGQAGGFDESQKIALRAAVPDVHFIVDEDGLERCFSGKTDLFRVLKDEFRVLTVPPLPSDEEDDEPVFETPPHHAGLEVGSSGVEAVTEVKDGYDEHRMQLMSMLNAEFNGLPSVEKEAMRNCGPPGSGSQKLWSSVSKAKRESFFKFMSTGEKEFAVRLEEVSAGLKKPANADLAAVLMYRLAMSKSQVKCELRDGGLYVTKE